jgi:hypothetical protein
MHFHFIALHVKSDIRHVKEIVGEILLDQTAFIATANNKAMGLPFNFEQMDDN